MMEQYFELKYYEEVAGYVIGGIMCVAIIVAPFAMVVFDSIKKWWKGE